VVEVWIGIGLVICVFVKIAGRSTYGYKAELRRLGMSKQPEKYVEPVCPNCGAAELYQVVDAYGTVTFAITGIKEDYTLRGWRMEEDVEIAPNGVWHTTECANCHSVWGDEDAADVVFDQAPRD
jgi:hypothetical protein